MQKTKLFSLLSLFVCSSSVLASVSTTPATNNTVAVTLPQLTPGYEINLAAVWLKPSATNLNYAIYNKALPAETPGWTEQELTPTYNLGFELGIRYVSPTDTDKDIQLKWTHLKSDTSTSVAAANAEDFIGPDFEIGPAGTDIRRANGSVTFRYDVVNLDMGQYATFGRHVQMRFFGGLSNGFLREEVMATYAGNATGAFPGPFSTTQDVNSNFTGIGPRVGLQADYSFNSNVSAFIESAVSALIGTLNTRTNYTSSAAELMTLYHKAVNYQTILNQTTMQVIPGLDAKLGINYKHTFKNNSLLTVSVGYEAAVYVNAISQFIPSRLVSGESMSTGGIFVDTMSHTLSNYSVQGPFVNVALQF